jgi:hypothetical protein
MTVAGQFVPFFLARTTWLVCVSTARLISELEIGVYWAVGRQMPSPVPPSLPESLPGFVSLLPLGKKVS